MSEIELPPLESCGFVRVPADSELWMKCDGCSKSDHFWLEEEQVRCRCGARYGFALRPDGVEVPFEELVFVAFEEGPKSLATMELDPRRLMVVGLVVLGVVGAGLWLWLG